MTKIPFFHYTYIDNLYDIIKNGQIHSRAWMIKKGVNFQDISIDPEQSIREDLGLLEYVPLFGGFYSLWRSYELNGYLMRHYDDPKIQNPSFFGSLNKILKPKLGELYERVIILLIKWDVIINFADKGYIRFFTDIAIKSEAEECDCFNKDDLIKNTDDNIITERDIYCEIDVLDDESRCIYFPGDIEAIIVDNDKLLNELTTQITSKFGKKVMKTIPIVIINPLPRYDDE